MTLIETKIVQKNLHLNRLRATRSNADQAINFLDKTNGTKTSIFEHIREICGEPARPSPAGNDDC